MHSCLLDASPLRAEPSAPVLPCAYLVRRAIHACEFDEAYALRRAVFCVEQGIFLRDDRDAIDDRAQLLVAQACEAGMPTQVVGTVRIHEAEPGVWWGSRLAVHASFRTLGHLGATLIRLAVSSAHAQGCERFMAQVQPQNAALFERLHWQPLREVLAHGRPHVEMQASLAHYPPCHDPVSGFVSRRSRGAS
ncbi:MAG TPA: MSMEG_0567/Sll0786 family nitrogen starvation N-acetyltransferase [Bordetella sp.]